jgi:hypothetical protein
MTFFGTTVSEKEAVGILKDGGSVRVIAEEQAFGGPGGVKGLWTIKVTDIEGIQYSVRVAQKSEIKLYRTPTGLFSFFEAAGFEQATLPMKAGSSVVLCLDSK